VTRHPAQARTGAVRLKRVYEPASPADGTRVLVERLWPRGLSKEHAAIDLWLKEIAPSRELRQWYAHVPARWELFREKYRLELAQRAEELARLVELCRGGDVTLVYAARDERRNSAVVLLDALRAAVPESVDAGQ
jgi:uncharacterized protein YeaO (DUF488 family)